MNLIRSFKIIKLYKTCEALFSYQKQLENALKLEKSNLENLVSDFVNGVFTWPRLRLPNFSGLIVLVVAF